MAEDCEDSTLGEQRVFASLILDTTNVDAHPGNDGYVLVLPLVRLSRVPFILKYADTGILTYRSAPGPSGVRGEMATASSSPGYPLGRRYIRCCPFSFLLSARGRGAAGVTFQLLDGEARGTRARLERVANWSPDQASAMPLSMRPGHRPKERPFLQVSPGYFLTCLSPTTRPWTCMVSCPRL